MSDSSRTPQPPEPTTTEAAGTAGPDDGWPTGPYEDPDDDVRADIYGDGIYAALAGAAGRRCTVVVALIDGTRLNGVPLGFSPPRGPAPTAPFTDLYGRRSRNGRDCGDCRGCLHCWPEGQCTADATAVLIREESGQPPFVVRLAHVVYVRALTAHDRSTRD